MMKKTTRSLATLFSMVAAATLIATVTPCPLVAYDGGFKDGGTRDGGVVSSAAVSHLGLTVDWTTQLEIGTLGEVAGMVLQVNEDNATNYFEVNYGSGREVISESDLDAFGNQFGVEGAREFAEIRKEVIEAELKSRQKDDIEVSIRQYALPESIIYASVTRGLVTAINADTGKVIWKNRIGDPGYTTTGVGANEKYVVVCNGSKVYCLEATTGRELWSVQAAGSPAAAPNVSGSAVFLALTNGRLEVIPLDGNGILSESFFGQGLGTAQPLVTRNSASWPTADGFYSVVLLSTRKRLTPLKDKDGNAVEDHDEHFGEIRPTAIAYRLRAGGELVSSGSAARGLLFVTSIDGFVYAVREKEGTVAWEFSTGDRLEQSAFPNGNDLYFVTTSNHLFKMDITRGLKSEGWEVPVAGISRFLGISGDKVFALDELENIVVLDSATGTGFGIARIGGIDMSMQNTQTNRLYLGNRKGLIQCVRESSSPIPVFHSGAGEQLAAAPGMGEGMNPDDALNEGAVAEPDEFDAPDTSAGDSPFGAPGSNPFGAQKPAPAGGGGASDNPFGGGASDNPFGGG